MDAIHAIIDGEIRRGRSCSLEFIVKLTRVVDPRRFDSGFYPNPDSNSHAKRSKHS